MRIEPSDSIVVTVTASQIIGPAVIRPVIIQGVSITPAAAAGTVALYDPIQQGVTTTVGATLRVIVGAVLSGATASHPCSASGIQFNNGCIAVVTGTGAQATISYAVV